MRKSKLFATGLASGLLLWMACSAKQTENNSTAHTENANKKQEIVAPKSSVQSKQDTVYVMGIHNQFDFYRLRTIAQVVNKKGKMFWIEEYGTNLLQFAQRGDVIVLRSYEDPQTKEQKLVTINNITAESIATNWLKQSQR